MIYKDFQNLKLSALGFGAMRLPVVDGDDTRVDESTTEKMVDYAMAHGINYYDTAWGYHAGNSELAMGKALNKHPRESYYLATKFPGYDLSNMGKAREIFEQQLKKCGVEYFDFYLFHNVCEMNIDAYLDKSYGIHDYLMKQKGAGRIRHLGFSAHGSLEVMKRFLAAYGEDMEFCQIQLNYVDWTFQNAKAKVELLKEYLIPVWVMEPLRGGKLASGVEQAFRFIQSIEGVVVTLSGMSTPGQLQENIRIFADDKPLSNEEMAALIESADNMVKKTTLPCTSCRYCVSHCPQSLDIPWLLKLYNEHCFTENGFIAPMALMSLPSEKQPGACIGCKSCEGVCPQQIKISDAMADFSKKMGE